MRNQMFALFALCVTFLVMQAFSYFRIQLSDERYLAYKNEQLREAVVRERLRLQVATHEFKEYQQQVAEVLPHLEGRSVKAYEKKVQARQLASVTLKTDEPMHVLELSGSLFNQGKKLFALKKFNNAEKMFARVVDEYPFSKNIIEAHFMLAESRYKIGDYRKCLEIVETMMKQFPSNELTGYIMLRMGQVFEKENRLEDAVRVYQTVRDSFQDKKVKEQAKTMLNNLKG